MRKKCECETCRNLRQAEPERPQGEYEIACNVLLSLEQIVRKSDGWEDSAVEAVHNAVQTAIKCMHDRPQGEIKKYKPLEPDYNVQCAVENVRSAYWSNEPEKVAKDFTEAEEIIISAICHQGYTVCKELQGEWIDYDNTFYKCPDCGYLLEKCCPQCQNKVILPKGGTE